MPFGDRAMTRFDIGDPRHELTRQRKAEKRELSVIADLNQGLDETRHLVILQSQILDEDAATTVRRDGEIAPDPGGSVEYEARYEASRVEDGLSVPVKILFSAY